ncbi:hypothetical protein [Sneathiella glossodoripedis]|uniref:hypothetical protein n=1 Tax=Sneathiella glossodoripedis TaxID=418853 RepID=UPI000472F4E7|nr:hypothetical protein [Sneathiella glossodoripedis]
MLQNTYRLAAFTFITAACLILAPIHQASAVSSYELEKIETALGNEKLTPKPDVFDGKNFGPTINRAAAQQHLNTYIRSLNSAIATFNSLSNDAKGSAQGQELLKILQDGQLTSKKMRSALSRTPEQITPSASDTQTATTGGSTSSGMSDYEKEQLAKDAASKAAKEKAREKLAAQRAEQAARQQKQREEKAAKAEHAKICNEFKSAAMTPKNRNAMLNMMLQVEQGNIALTSPEQIEETRLVAENVQSVCAGTDMQALTARKCYYTGSTFEQDPVKWCEAAEQGQTLVKAMAMNGAKRMVGSLGSSLIQSPKEFRDRNGFLTFEGPVTYQGSLTFSADKLSNQRETVEKLLVASGEPDPEKVWDEQKVRLETLKAAVDETAEDWKLPPNVDSDYSSDLAAKLIERMHDDDDVEIIDAWLSRGSWKIHRNALGVILRRSRPGYVLFKLDDDPYCQLKSYTQTEQYVGGGNYQKTDTIRFGYVRFQSCDT